MHHQSCWAATGKRGRKAAPLKEPVAYLPHAKVDQRVDTGTELGSMIHCFSVEYLLLQIASFKSTARIKFLLNVYFMFKIKHIHN